MPIPPALLARLQKRGIPVTDSNNKNEDEEVFAEDYDEPGKPDVIPKHPDGPDTHASDGKDDDTGDSELDGILVHEVLACANKSNPFHECSPYCKKRYGTKKFLEDGEMKARRQRMLSKYPLPPGWLEVGDATTGRYYYWNALTEQVSWLSPSHPKAIITQPSEKLKDILMAEDNSDEGLSDDSISDLDSLSESDSDSDEKKRGRQDLKRGRGGRGGGRGNIKRGRQKKDELDPMDPAAYSDVPRGDWHSGLESRSSDAKTGVDVTANGPLFQQRPYPSPGEVLRRNKSS